jgi:hypothetical protein
MQQPGFVTDRAEIELSVTHQGLSDSVTITIEVSSGSGVM